MRNLENIKSSTDLQVLSSSGLSNKYFNSLFVKINTNHKEKN